MTARSPSPGPCVPACSPTSLSPDQDPLTDVEATQAHTAVRPLTIPTDGADVGVPSELPQAQQRVIECAVFDAAEVGQVLGVGRATVYALNSREEMPAALTVGRGLRWAKAEVLAWVLHGTPPRATWERAWPRIRREVIRR